MTIACARPWNTLTCCKGNTLIPLVRPRAPFLTRTKLWLVKISSLVYPPPMKHFPACARRLHRVEDYIQPSSSRSYWDCRFESSLTSIDNLFNEFRYQGDEFFRTILLSCRVHRVALSSVKPTPAGTPARLAPAGFPRFRLALARRISVRWFVRASPQKRSVPH